MKLVEIKRAEASSTELRREHQGPNVFAFNHCSVSFSGHYSCTLASVSVPGCAVSLAQFQLGDVILDETEVQGSYDVTQDLIEPLFHL